MGHTDPTPRQGFDPDEMTMMGKRPRTEMPTELHVNPNDHPASAVVIRDFGRVWDEAKWSNNLRNDTTTPATLKDLRTILTTTRLSPDQITLRLFETWPAISQLKDLNDVWPGCGV